jgi:hypothetical protein
VCKFSMAMTSPTSVGVRWRHSPCLASGKIKLFSRSRERLTALKERRLQVRVQTPQLGTTPPPFKTETFQYQDHSGRRRRVSLFNSIAENICQQTFRSLFHQLPHSLRSRRIIAFFCDDVKAPGRFLVLPVCDLTEGIFADDVL